MKTPGVLRETMTFTGLKPEYIHVRFAGREADLIHYRLGQGEPQALIMAGVHGREHGGVQAAYELLERLTAMSLRGADRHLACLQ
jgi:predicted deacylase